jgi:putative tricarboxylic transport membrane protein
VRSDRLLGAICLIVGVALIWGAMRIETGLIVDPLGPRSFPAIIGGVLALAALFVLLRPDPEPAWPRLQRWLEIAAAVIILTGYALALEPLGFVIATAIASALLSWRLGSSPHWALAAGIGISLGIYAVFHLLLGISLARGPLGF